MALVNVVSLSEAFFFTAGCAVLRSTRLDPERIGIVLIALTAALVLAVTIALSPEYATPSAGIGPDEIHSVLE